MKKLFAIVLMALSFGVFAEASFDEIEGLIQQKNYAAAASGLEGIIQAHPKSAKAFYAMAQAQAGLGNLEKANKALTIAQGLNPTLDFAPAESVAKLKQAITPQVSKIEAVEESHFWRNLFLLLFLGATGYIVYFLLTSSSRADKAAAEREQKARELEEAKQAMRDHLAAMEEKDRQYKAAMNASVSSKAATAASYTPRPAYTGPTSTVSSTPVATPAPAPTVVNNHYGSSNDGLLTGMIIGDMMSHHHHDTTRVVEREVIREVPVKSEGSGYASPKSSSWDDTTINEERSSRSSSWDTPSSRSRSSSWDSDSSSSSSSSSSWSSSSSDSSSSWDSGSSSSDSSSSWD